MHTAAKYKPAQGIANSLSSISAVEAVIKGAGPSDSLVRYPCAVAKINRVGSPGFSRLAIRGFSGPPRPPEGRDSKRDECNFELSVRSAREVDPSDPPLAV